MVTLHSGTDMDIIFVSHPAFNMEISTEYSEENTFFDIYQKAKERNTSDYFFTTYWFSEKLLDFSIWDPGRDFLKRNTIDTVKYPVFFEDQTYHFMIEFSDDVSNVGIYSKNKQIEHAFRTKKTKYGPILWGEIEFTGNIGSFELNICYDIGTISKSIIFRFEIFPVNLALKKHFPLMVNDIEAIYPRLVIDYMKPTYHFFESAPGRYHNMIWWIVFENIYRDILKNLSIIFDHAHSGLVDAKVLKKKREIYNPTEEQTQEIKRYKGDPNKQFELPGSLILKDNYENQVVKFILKDVINKFQLIYKLVTDSDAGKKMTTAYRAQLEYVHKALTSVTGLPFYAELSEISAVKEVTHVLKQKTGYVDLLDDWNKLKGGYRLFEGVYEIELKDTAYIYKLWCFIGMAELIRLSGGRKVKVLKVPEVMPDHLLALAGKDAHSCIMFEHDNGDKIELYHELVYDENFNNGSGSFTAPVRPDIVFRIRKRDLPDNLYLTYIFNARYKVRESDNYKFPDLPALEALAQMHEYRDAVYFREAKKGRLSKEIKGAYILYPGQGTLEQFKNMRQSVPDDTGGIPFCPGQDTTNVLLEDLISYIINTDAATLLMDTSPQKGKEYKKDDTVVHIPFIGKRDTVLINYLKTTDIPILNYKSIPPALGEGKLRYVAPYIEGEGITAIYEIEHFYWKPRKDIYPPDHDLFRNETKKCLSLHLMNKTELVAPLQIKGVVNNQRYTKMKYINSPVNGFVKTIPERETLIRNQNS